MLNKERETMEILQSIPFTIKREDVIKALQMGRTPESVEMIIDDLLPQSESAANPKALFKVSYIENRNEDTIHIDGREFKSRVLSRNLERVERIFPYVVTAGRELDAIEIDKNDIMRMYCFDAIKELILEAAILHLEEYIKGEFTPGIMAHMNPGSLSDWPITQQKILFSLFGDVEELIGVRLTESFLMDPIKSVSGIHFPTEFDFKSCMLCTRHPCIKRKAAFDPEMAKNYNKK